MEQVWNKYEIYVFLIVNVMRDISFQIFQSKFMPYQGKSWKISVRNISRCYLHQIFILQN